MMTQTQSLAQSLAIVLLLGVAASAIRPLATTTQMAFSSLRSPNNLPVVLWHGMGDSCCASYSIGAIKALIEEKLGVFVHSIATGDGALGDVWSSYFGNVNDQVAKACEEIRAIPELAGGYNAIGFSQGGQFIRALVQRCQHLGPKAHTLITMGAQHQGVANVPGCSTVPANLTAEEATVLALVGGTEAVAAAADLASAGASACETMQTILGKGAYLPWVATHVVQAQYFKDPARIEQYLKSNPFLPDVNNELEAKNHQYAENLASLDTLVLYRFTEDTTVVPRDSSWFSTLDADRQLVPLREQPLYKDDLLGLKRLDERGALLLLDAQSAHMQFTLDWFEANVMWKFLAGDASDEDVQTEEPLVALAAQAVA